MKLREIQLQELKILKEFLEICKKYNLNYYMLGGTFLGAIRHKGFIPWDDDIDIGMPRPDYESFLRFAKTELKDPYELKSFTTDENYYHYTLRIINKNILITRDDALDKKKDYIWIDIFPLDGMPNRVIIRGFHKFNLLFHRLLLQYSKFNTGVNMKKKRSLLEAFLIKIGFVLSKIMHFNVKKRLMAIDKLLKKYNYNESKYVVNFMGAYKFKEMFPKKYYDKPIEYDFENLKLIGASEYDKILTQMYGNYMKPPAQNQRFSHSIKTEDNNEQSK